MLYLERWIKNRTDLQKGVLFALVAAFISGFAIYFAKLSLANISPLVLTTSRNFVAGIIFLSLILLSGKLYKLKKLDKYILFKLVLVGVFGGALPFYLFFTGLQSVESSVANFIHKTLFIWVVLLGAVWLKEKYSQVFMVSFFMIALSLVFILPGSFIFDNGGVFIISATLLWSIETVFVKKLLKDVSSELVGLARMGVGSLFLLGIVFFTGSGSTLLSLNMTQLIAIVSGGATLFFYVFFWYKALKFAPAGVVSLILTFSLVVGSILQNNVDLTLAFTVFSGVALLVINFFLPETKTLQKEVLNEK